jgi:hypothetical protein
MGTIPREVGETAVGNERHIARPQAVTDLGGITVPQRMVDDGNGQAGLLNGDTGRCYGEGLSLGA